MELTYKYRIYPTKKQMSDVRNICSATRFLYYKMLEDRTQHYREKRQWKRLDSKPFIELFPFLAQTDPGHWHGLLIGWIERTGISSS